MLNRTPFFDFHTSQNARLVDFAGWEMPLVYRSIVDEHQQTRSSGSIFDVSHMGRLHLTGRGVVGFLDHVLTRNVADQKIGQSRYSLVCNEQGGVLDDVIVSRDLKNWIVVCNASNREKIIAHFNSERRQGDFDVDISDQTQASAMLAIQGPKVIERLAKVMPIDLIELPRHHFVSDSVMLVKFTIFRSGYTGEDGVEIILSAKTAPLAMKLLGGQMGKADATIKPAGLGARDTLRLEAGLPLYGHELDESGDPLSAGLGWAVDLSKTFVGSAAISRIKEAGIPRKRVGLALEGPRIARQGASVMYEGQPAGVVTSGTMSPTLGKSIAMAYVKPGLAPVGTQLMIDIKGSLVPARVVSLPFYKKPGSAC